MLPTSPSENIMVDIMIIAVDNENNNDNDALMVAGDF